jgi:hypothetical protein
MAIEDCLSALLSALQYREKKAGPSAPLRMTRFERLSFAEGPSIFLRCVVL